MYCTHYLVKRNVKDDIADLVCQTMSDLKIVYVIDYLSDAKQGVFNMAGLAVWHGWIRETWLLSDGL